MTIEIYDKTFIKMGVGYTCFNWEQERDSEREMYWSVCKKGLTTWPLKFMIKPPLKINV